MAFSEYKNGIPCCAVLDQRTGKFLYKYPLKDRLYHMPFSCPATKVITIQANLIVTNVELNTSMSGVAGSDTRTQVEFNRYVESTLPLFGSVTPASSSSNTFRA